MPGEGLWRGADPTGISVLINCCRKCHCYYSASCTLMSCLPETKFSRALEWITILKMNTQQWHSPAAGAWDELLRAGCALVWAIPELPPCLARDEPLCTLCVGSWAALVTPMSLPAEGSVGRAVNHLSFLLISELTQIRLLQAEEADQGGRRWLLCVISLHCN